MLGNTLGDANNEGDFSGDGFLDASSGEWGAVDRGRLAHLAGS
jgi:hypothetical protein